jgi:hypothetical protein
MSQPIDLEDLGHGSVLVSWPPVPGATDYRVYVNGAFQLATGGARSATIAGLQFASYNAATQVKTPALSYTVEVTSIVGGLEGRPRLAAYTPSPTSVNLVTPMKRDVPFGNVLP